MERFANITKHYDWLRTTEKFAEGTPMTVKTESDGSITYIAGNAVYTDKAKEFINDCKTAIGRWSWEYEHSSVDWDVRNNDVMKVFGDFLRIDFSKYDFSEYNNYRKICFWMRDLLLGENIYRGAWLYAFEKGAFLNLCKYFLKFDNKKQSVQFDGKTYDYVPLYTGGYGNYVIEMDGHYYLYDVSTGDAPPVEREYVDSILKFSYFEEFVGEIPVEHKAIVEKQLIQALRKPHIKSKQNEIILNRMYAGDYLKSDNNIGHEIINLFQADNGKYYVYINPYGSIGSSHDDKVRTVLMVRGHGEHMLEVLAKTEGRLKQWVYDKHSKVKKDDEKYREEHQEIHNRHVKMLKNVTYGGKSLEDIFEDNQDNDIAYYATFKADKIIKVKEPIYLVDANYQQQVGGNMYKLEDLNNFSKQSLRMYVSQDKHFKSYDTLADIINSPEFWGEAVGQVKDIEQPQNDTENDNIFKIIKKEYDELVVSNMLAYYLEKYRWLFDSFAKEVLKIDNFEVSDVAKLSGLIEREKHIEVEGKKGQIDILVRDVGSKNIIVIENKIKSGINGIVENSDIHDKCIQSQLTNYYNWVQEQEEYNDYNKYFYIFVPNYSKLDVNKYSFGNKYTVICYSKIYKWFKEIYPFLKEREKIDNEIYYNDFLALLEKHSKSTDDFEEEMRLRFSKVIKETTLRDAIKRRTKIDKNNWDMNFKED